jgi:primosomal protein N''
VTKFASEAVMNEGVLYVYYSRAFPRFATELSRLEGHDTTLARSFERRYKTWLAVHSILLERQQDEVEALSVDDQTSAEMERQERCRLATIAAMAAAQEAKTGLALEEEAA